jgi:hypothetical protein
MAPVWKSTGTPRRFCLGPNSLPLTKRPLVSMFNWDTSNTQPPCPIVKMPTYALTTPIQPRHQSGLRNLGLSLRGKAPQVLLLLANSGVAPPTVLVRFPSRIRSPRNKIATMIARMAIRTASASFVQSVVTQIVAVEQPLRPSTRSTRSILMLPDFIFPLPRRGSKVLDVGLCASVVA